MVLDPRSVGDHSCVVIHNSPIEQVNSYKYLGVHLDDTFRWNVHVDTLCSHLQQTETVRCGQAIMFLFYQAVLHTLI